MAEGFAKIFLSDTKPFVKKALETRQSMAIDNPDNARWFYQKTPWIRLISNAIEVTNIDLTSVSTLGETAAVVNTEASVISAELRKKYILFGGVQKYTTGQGTSATVEYTGGTDLSVSHFEADPTTMDKENVREALKNNTSDWANAIRQKLNEIEIDQAEARRELERRVAEINDTVSTPVNGLIDNVRDVYRVDNRPIAGITSANIAYKGSFGSTREGKIEFQCWSLTDLEALEKLYMTPGITLFLEWGWSIKHDGSEVTSLWEQVLDNEEWTSTTFQSEIIKLIQANIEENDGCYDAMIGVVSDFSWSMNNNGGFDCSVTIISLADTLVSADIKAPAIRGCQSYSTDEDKYETPSKFVLALRALKQKLDSITIYKSVLRPDPDNSTDSGSFAWKHNATLADGRGLIEEGGKEVDGMEYYISIGYLEKILSECTSYVPGPINTINVRRRTSYGGSTERTEQAVAGSSTTISDEDIIPKFNSTGVIIKNNELVISAEPFVCVLPGQEFYTDAARQYSNLFPKEVYFATDDTKNEGYVRRILLNMYYLIEEYKNHETVDSFMVAVLNRVSDACGGIWQFQLMVDEDNPDYVKIIDTLAEYNPSESNYITLLTYNRASILKSISMQTQLDGKLATQVVYGTNKESREEVGRASTDAYSFYGVVVQDKYLNRLRPISVGETDANQKCADETGVIKDDQQTWDDLLTDRREIFRQLYAYKSNDPDTISAAKNNLTAMLNFKKSADDESITYKQWLILPISMNFSVDGIGGLRWGNAIHIDYLPSRYKPEAVLFQITNITHEISPSEWNTSAETIMRVNDPKKYGNVDTSYDFETDGTGTTDTISTTGTNYGSTTNFFSPLPELYKHRMKNPTLGTITSKPGLRNLTGSGTTFHKGIDISDAEGTFVRAALGGKVIYTRTGATGPGSVGNEVHIEHEFNGKFYITKYKHLQTVTVQKDQTVKMLDKIGTMGNTGYVVSGGKRILDSSSNKGVHLHFEVCDREGNLYNPYDVLVESEIGTATYNLAYK